MVEDEDIHLTINTFNANLKTVAEQLVGLANENGGRDNITISMAMILGSFAVSKGLVGKIKKILR